MAQKLRMNRSMGTAWFTFYTKVRPVFSALVVISSLVSVVEYWELCLTHFSLLLVFALQLVQFAFCILVRIKAYEDYDEFVRIVKPILLFEVLSIAFQLGVQMHYSNGYDWNVSALVAVLYIVIDYFLWYRLNMKYFLKRLIRAPEDASDDDSSVEQNEPENTDETQTSYYEVLQVTANASDEVIRMAYKALAKMYHPDIFQGDPQFAEEMMKKINEAYEVLSNPQTRKAYDESLHNKHDTTRTEKMSTQTTAFRNVPKKRWLVWVGILLTLGLSLLANIIQGIQMNREVDRYLELSSELQFFEEHAVCVSSSNSEVYHKYRCSEFSNDG